MIRALKKISTEATEHLQKKLKVRAIIKATAHFQERMVQRFSDEDLPHLERAIEKAFEKAKPGQKIRYTHPAYNVTVVGTKQGLNMFELVTCWQREEDAE